MTLAVKTKGKRGLSHPQSEGIDQGREPVSSLFDSHTNEYDRETEISKRIYLKKQSSRTWPGLAPTAHIMDVEAWVIQGEGTLIVRHSVNVQDSSDVYTNNAATVIDISTTFEHV